MALNTPDPETTPRGKLGQYLRRLRQAAGHATQPPFASKLGVSPALISKIETGTHVPTQDIFQAWLDLCQVTEEARAYITDTWLIARASTSGIPEPIEIWVENERQATFLRLWGLLFMPAQLQTPDYARAMFLSHGMDEDEAAEQTGIRMGRQAILDGPEPAHVVAVIHELALRNLVGTPEIMAGQLTHVLGLSKKRNVHIQVVRDFGYFAGMEGAFEIATGDAIPDTLITLNFQEQASDDRTLARKAIESFETIRSYALNITDSRVLIQEANEQWNSQQQ
jgi:transcriptional regulator with XRE-family HTH domain